MAMEVLKKLLNDEIRARSKHTQYYLHENGSLSTAKPGEKESMTSYQFDPKDPVPMIGGNSCCGWFEYGAFNQWGGNHVSTWDKPIPISARNDILVFQLKPLSEDVCRPKIFETFFFIDTCFSFKMGEPFGDNCFNRITIQYQSNDEFILSFLIFPVTFKYTKHYAAQK